MNISERSVGSSKCWELEALPGDGLIASGPHHVLIVEVDDDTVTSGIADDIVATYDAHSRLLGRGAARSLRLVISTILAEHQATPCTVALVSAWDEEIAVYLHGHASATLHGDGRTITLHGDGSLIATDVVLANDFDEMELCVGEQPDDKRTPIDIGGITTGRGVRLTWRGQHNASGPLNEWFSDR